MMERSRATLTCVSILLMVLAACVPTVTPAPITPSTPVTPTPVTPTSTPSSGCHLNGTLEDPHCTPGALNPAVNAANFHQVICIGGTSQFRPPQAKTDEWKRSVAQNYSITNFDPSQYEGDHRVPLALGGFPGADGDYSNFWDEPRDGTLNANDKDKVELYLYRQACAGTIALADAQAYFLTDQWTTLVSQARLMISDAELDEDDR